MAELSRLVNIENCQCPRATFTDGTKLHTLQYDISMAPMLDNEWTLTNGPKARKASVRKGMLLTDFLAVMAYLEWK